MSNPVAYLAGTWKQIDQENIDKQLEAQGKLTLTRPIGLTPHTPVAQKIADQVGYCE